LLAEVSGTLIWVSGVGIAGWTPRVDGASDLGVLLQGHRRLLLILSSIVIVVKNTMAQDDTDSRYSKLETPKFESKIPTHLLDRLSEQEKWLVETLSRIDQKSDWFMEAIVRTNEIEREIDVRLARVERFTGKWAVVGAGGVIALTALLGAAAKAILGHFWP
jgi:hydrogenase maturation factor